jgi:hypothetical protein
MPNLAKQVRVLEGVRPDKIPFDELFEANEPVILRGLVSDWDLVYLLRTLKQMLDFFIMSNALVSITKVNSSNSVKYSVKFVTAKMILSALITT